MPSIRGTFDVSTLPQPPEADARFAAVSRLLLDKRYAGPLQAVSRGQMLAIGGEAGWGRWILSIYAPLGLAPPPELSELLASLPPQERSLLAPAAQRALDSSGTRGGAVDSAGQSALSRLLGGKKP